MVTTMLPATATVTQTYSPASDTVRPALVSLVVTPQETRTIENGERSATARDRFGNDSSTDEERAAKRRGEAAPHQAEDAPVERRYGRNLNMVFDEKNGRPIIEILNPRTGEVVDRIPPENLLERAEREGLPPRANLVDETA